MIEIPYQVAALGLSFLTIVVYLVLLLIAARRAASRGRADVSIHARFIEGPLVTVGLLLGLFTLVSALNLNNPEYQDILVLTMAAVRGAVLAAGLYMLGFFWVVRDTWRR